MLRSGNEKLGGASIDRRLARWMMLITCSSLVVACGFFVLYDTITGRESMADASAILARVVGINSAVALTFRDTDVAEETLAGLAAAHEVLAATIYDSDGRPFATYDTRNQSAAVPSAPALGADGYEFRGNQLHLVQPIAFQDEAIGSIYLLLDASSLAARLLWFLATSVLLIALTAVIASVASARMRRQISRPLEALLESSKAISEGDLTVHVPVSTDDELGVLARTFNAMTAGLRQLVIQVGQSIGEVAAVSDGLEDRGARLLSEGQRQREATQAVSQSVEQVTRSIHSVNENVEQLVDTAQETSSSILEMDASIGEIASHMDQLTTAIDTTSTAVSQLTTNIGQVIGGVETLNSAAEVSAGHVHELSTSVGQVSANAAESHTLSEESSLAARQGMTAVNETIDAMGEISSSFGQLRSSVSRLAEKSQSIDEIVQVITDVAEQTSRLSLNAAIIAAQAGEHGKAFSVVAEQVSGLADRTHRSAREIADLITTVKQDTAAAVNSVGEGSAKVEKGVQRSHVAGEVLGQIIEKTAASTNRVHEIVDATSRQSEDLGRVDRAVRDVIESVAQVNRATLDQKAATQEIANAIESIRNLGIAVRHSTEEQRRGSGLITKAAANVAEMVNQIATSTNEQANSSQVIEHAVQIFSDVVSETAQGAEAINSSVATLSVRAARLQKEIGRFKTE